MCASNFSRVKPGPHGPESYKGVGTYKLMYLYWRARALNCFQAIVDIVQLKQPYLEQCLDIFNVPLFSLSRLMWNTGLTSISDKNQVREFSRRRNARFNFALTVRAALSYSIVLPWIVIRPAKIKGLLKNTRRLLAIAAGIVPLSCVIRIYNNTTYDGFSKRSTAKEKYWNMFTKATNHVAIITNK